jgi:hypothetical protein
MDDEEIVAASEMLLGAVIDDAVFGWEDIGLADLHVARERDGDAHVVARDVETGKAAERLRKRLPPRVELRAAGGSGADQQIERELALLGHADFVGAGEPARVGADRNGAVRVRRHLQPHEHRIIVLVDVVHEVSDLDPPGHRVAQRTGRKALRQAPLHVHRQASIAGVQPIAVPARVGAHVDGKLDLAARRRWAFGDQLRRDVLRLRECWHEQKREKN